MDSGHRERAGLAYAKYLALRFDLAIIISVKSKFKIISSTRSPAKRVINVYIIAIIHVQIEFEIPASSHYNIYRAHFPGMIYNLL